MYTNNNKDNWVSKNITYNSRKKNRPKNVIKAGDYKITINNKNYRLNPFTLIQKMSRLRNNDDLSKKEKETKLKEIIKEYMG